MGRDGGGSEDGESDGDGDGVNIEVVHVFVWGVGGWLRKVEWLGE